MKKTLLSLMITIALLAGATICTAAELKIGYVNIQRAVGESKSGKAANEKFTVEASRIRDDIMKDKESIEQAAEMLQKQSAMLTAVSAAPRNWRWHAANAITNAW